jgi:DNA-binding HxlR family transcriptional regulator
VKGYGQFCPIAKAAEILAERWTLLVVRELLLGSQRYNDIRRGVPRMSPTLLADRLKQLEEAGIVERRQNRGDSAVEYHLTEAGLQLQPLMGTLATWGYQWANRTLSRDDLDPGFLMWSIRRNLVIKSLPATRTVIYIEFSDGRPPRRWWLVVAGGDADLCMKDPGYEVDLFVHTDVLTLTRIFDCRISIAEARSSGRVKLQGSVVLVRTIDKWFGRPAAKRLGNCA